MRRILITLSLLLGVALTAHAQLLNSQYTNPRYLYQKARYEAGTRGTTPGKLVGSAISKLRKGGSSKVEDNNVSYLNSELGFKGKHPSSYTELTEYAEQGIAGFLSSDEAITVLYHGQRTDGRAIDEIFAEEQASMAEEYEVVSADCTDSDFTIVCNCGGAMMTERCIVKGDRSATILVQYPEENAKAYKKQVKSLIDDLSFYK